MSSKESFSSMTKQELLMIIRQTKIMPISQATRMRKQQIVEEIFKHEDIVSIYTSLLANGEDLSGNESFTGRKKRARARAARFKTDEAENSGDSTKSVETSKESTVTLKRKPGRPPKNANTEIAIEKNEATPQEPTPKETAPVEVPAELEADNSEAKHGQHRNKKTPKNNSRNNNKSKYAKNNAAATKYEESSRSRHNADSDNESKYARDHVKARKSRRDKNKKFDASNENDNREKVVHNHLDEFYGNNVYASDSHDIFDDASDDRSASTNEQEVYTGILEILPDGYGFIRRENYAQGPNDLYAPPQFIRKYGLRPGDEVVCSCRKDRDQERYKSVCYIHSVNGQTPEKMRHRPHFGRLTPIYPQERFRLETTQKELSTRIIDLVSPIGKGQRAMIVSPPKAGKTVLLQKIANAIVQNSPETKLIVLLIDERPEEVTDMQRSIRGEVAYSTFDKVQENHVKITELVLERAKRLVELGQDVVILLDSMTRLARAYNLNITPTGRTLSGGLDPGALYGPKRFFGAARKIENGGSLTIIATSLIETGSRMDEVIFEEFKGTGNMEVVLDRKMADKRIFPAIDVLKSGTRREDLLLSRVELESVWSMRKALANMEAAAATEMIVKLLLKTKNNEHFIGTINASLSDKTLGDGLPISPERESTTGGNDNSVTSTANGNGRYRRGE